MKRMKKLTGLLIMTAIVLGMSISALAAPKLDRKKVVTGVGEVERLWLEGASGTVKWKSKNPKVAKIVNPNGNTTEVAAKKAGTTYITATCNKKTYVCKFTCKKISLSATKATLKKGKTKTLRLNYAKLTKGRVLTWTISNTCVLSIQKTVGNKMTVKAVGAGKATVTAKYRKKTYKCVITVKDSSGSGGSSSNNSGTLLSVSAATVNLSVGSSKTVNIYYKGGSNGTVSYSYPDSSLVSASFGEWNQAGDTVPLTITGKSAGTTTVTISESTKGEKIELTVKIS